MNSTCPKCDGMGMRVFDRAGKQYAEACDCREADRPQRLLARAKVPRRYEHCILDSYECDFGVDPSLPSAKILAQNFVREYPLGTEGQGLLLTGSIGVGKTHLAV